MYKHLVPLVVCVSVFITSSQSHELHAHGHLRRETNPDPIPHTTREYWMRRANQALSDLASPCPFASFGTVIVNHTDPNSLGEEICIGVNSNSAEGNPYLHGEMVGIRNCTAVLQGPRFNLNSKQTLDAFKSLTLYTNAEPCPMCASAIRWAGMKENVYGTSIGFLVEKGWGQIDISSKEIFERSAGLKTETRLIGEVLTNETNPYFSWQFEPGTPCPAGCSRSEASENCMPDQ